jgi:hypothetical protein
MEPTNLAGRRGDATSISGIIKNLEVEQVGEFPPEKLKYIRILCSEFAFAFDKKFSVIADKNKRKTIVTRLE